MADRTRIYKSTDWLISTYAPEEGSFVLNFSQLNGVDILGTTGGTLNAVEAKIASISLTEGAEISEGLFHTITPAMMNAEFVIENFTAADANKFVIGTQCALGLKNATSTSTFTYFGLDVKAENYTNFFEGFIESFSVQLDPGTNFATITMSAISKISKDLNTLIGVEKNTTSRKGELIKAANQDLLWDYDNDFWSFGVTEFEEKSLGDFLSDFVLCENALSRDSCLVYSSGGIAFDSGTFILVPIFQQFLNITSENETQTPIIEFDENNLSMIGMDWSGAGSPTGVALSLYSDSAITYNYGEPNSPGAFVFSATPDVKNLEQMQYVGNSMLDFRKEFAPITISTETARTYQDLIFKLSEPIYFALPGVPTLETSFHLKPKYLAEVLETVSVTNTQLGYNDLPMIVTGRTIEITPDNWTTTYNLWKGFTN
jgi:hypothetical protein